MFSANDQISYYFELKPSLGKIIINILFAYNLFPCFLVIEMDEYLI